MGGSQVLCPRLCTVCARAPTHTGPHCSSAAGRVLQPPACSSGHPHLCPATGSVPQLPALHSRHPLHTPATHSTLLLPAPHSSHQCGSFCLPSASSSCGSHTPAAHVGLWLTAPCWLPVPCHNHSHPAPTICPTPQLPAPPLWSVLGLQLAGSHAPRPPISLPLLRLSRSCSAACLHTAPLSSLTIASLLWPSGVLL